LRIVIGSNGCASKARVIFGILQRTNCCQPPS
jgi:hypothetical protein